MLIFVSRALSTASSEPLSLKLSTCSLLGDSGKLVSSFELGGSSLPFSCGSVNSNRLVSTPHHFHISSEAKFQNLRGQ